MNRGPRPKELPDERRYYVEGNWLVRGERTFAGGCVVWIGQGRDAARRQMQRLLECGWVGVRKGLAE